MEDLKLLILNCVELHMKKATKQLGIYWSVSYHGKEMSRKDLRITSYARFL